jgi:hypothetical protein
MRSLGGRIRPLSQSGLFLVRLILRIELQTNVARAFATTVVLRAGSPNSGTAVWELSR